MGNSASSQRREGETVQIRQVEQHGDRWSRLPVLHDQRVWQTVRRRTTIRRSRIGVSRSETAPLTGAESQSAAEHPLAEAGLERDVAGSVYETEGHPLFDTQTAQTTEQRPINSLGRSSSTMSRLGSRLLPDSVMRSLLSSGEETAEEGEALRQGVAIRRHASVFERRAPGSSNERFSISGTIRRHRESRTESRRRSIRGPFPLGHSEHRLLQGEPSNSLGLETTELDMPNGVRDDDGSLRQSSRFSRIRNSISLPLTHVFQSSRDRRSARHMPRSPTPHPGYVSPLNDSDHLLPSVAGAHVRSDGDDAPHELDAVEPETRSMLSSSRITSGMSTIRRIPHGFRSRSRLIRRGEHPPLSQVLQLAAAAIAAQLGGQSGPGTDGLRSLGGEAFDGSIQNFVQTLQDAASAQAGEDLDIHATDGDLPPVNFMRVFQFPNDENGTPMPHAHMHDPDRMDMDSSSASDGDRSVTLVLVGVRSMPNTQDTSPTETGGIGPSLDTLLSLPFLPPATMLNNGSSGALFRRADTRTRVNRRHSLTNFNFPAQYESQRHYRTRSAISRPLSEHPPAAAAAAASHHSISTPVSDSPPGPHPPPSTPADVRSEQVTPIRRPSSASGVHTPSLPDLEEDRFNESVAVPIEQPFTVPRQRRRSDSEFARRPELGSGAARRHGMVEPDRPVMGAGRSWLIYVVGTNVSPDHPAFTMPSLFTDNPTYEDMQMLSTLLGPVKPPVASQDDVNVAGGLYRLSVQNAVLIAEPLNATGSNHVLTITKGDRCLICLCDYEPAEDVRQLDSCRHVFHRECIDEWLTTGRNSCPMCRGQGVKESSSESNMQGAGEATT